MSLPRSSCCRISPDESSCCRGVHIRVLPCVRCHGARRRCCPLWSISRAFPLVSSLGSSATHKAVPAVGRLRTARQSLLPVVSQLANGVGTVKCERPFFSSYIPNAKRTCGSAPAYNPNANLATNCSKAVQALRACTSAPKQTLLGLTARVYDPTKKSSRRAPRKGRERSWCQSRRSREEKLVRAIHVSDAS